MPKAKKSGGAMICTKGQLRQLVKFVMPGNYRDLSMIHMMKDAGLRVGDISNIRMGHVRKVIDDPNLEFHQFTITQSKTGEDAHPIIGPEAIETLRQWLKQRTDMGIDSDYLYVSLQNNADYYLGGTLVRGSKRGDGITSGNITSMFGKLVKRAKLGGQRISAHSLRKYHSTRTIVGGLTDSMMKTLQGKDLGDSLGPYIDFTEDELMLRYTMAYSELRISERDSDSKLADTLATIARSNGASDDEIQRIRNALDEGRITFDGYQKGIDELIKRHTVESKVTVIEEKELENHLNHGWVFVGCTPSGRCIVKKS